MKKSIVFLFFIIFIFNGIFLIGCDSNPANTTTFEDTSSELLLSDYTLPTNFAMTIKISDTKIFKPGDPWYFKTAKINNDWQLINYDCELADLSQQESHFFEYLSDDLYNHYLYDYSTETWVLQTEVSFMEIFELCPNNFKFFHSEPDEALYKIIETEPTYDTDATSKRNLIDAIKYEYKVSLSYETYVDSNYLDVSLSECSRDGSTICTEWYAYDYCTSITAWDNTYLLCRNYKLSPTSA